MESDTEGKRKSNTFPVEMLLSVPDYIFTTNTLCLSVWSVISLTLCSLNKAQRCIAIRHHSNYAHLQLFSQKFHVRNTKCIFCPVFSVNKEMLFILLPHKNCHSLQLVQRHLMSTMACSNIYSQTAGRTNVSSSSNLNKETSPLCCCTQTPGDN